MPNTPSATPSVYLHAERIGLVTLALLVFAPYMLINQITAHWPAHDLSTALDHAIPFQPVWELIYVSIYFYVLIPVVYIRDPALFRRTVLAFCSMQLVCYGFFLSFPVGIARPELTELHSNFLHWGLALNYVLDQPRNLFPSLHLANAFMISLLLYRVDRQIGRAALIWASLIGYSTLAAKHHLLGDVVAGIALALVVDRWLFAPVTQTPLAADALYPRRNMAFLLLAYPTGILLFYLLWRAGWQPFHWPPA